jgi:hypothetical protein
MLRGGGHETRHIVGCLGGLLNFSQ